MAFSWDWFLISILVSFALILYFTQIRRIRAHSVYSLFDTSADVPKLHLARNLFPPTHLKIPHQPHILIGNAYKIHTPSRDIFYSYIFLFYLLHHEPQPFFPFFPVSLKIPFLDGSLKNILNESLT